MRIAVYLMVTMAIVHLSEGTFRRKNKNKGPFGGHLLGIGSAALDGFLRYAPDFYDAVPAVANKLLGGGKRHKFNGFGGYGYDYDNSRPLINSAKRAMKQVNHLLRRPHVVPVPVYPTHGYGGYGYGNDLGLGHLGGFSGYSAHPWSIPHGSFDELPVHGYFHDSVDTLGKFPSSGFHSFDSFYGHDHLNQIDDFNYHL